MKYTNQQTFDRIVRHLRKQNARALDADGCCVYLAPNGKKCAAGCLITKREYSPDFEGMSVSRLDGSDISPIGSLIRKKGHNIRLVRALQQVHDDASIAWESGFQDVARRFKVKYVPPKTPKTLSQAV